jgi:hypothetical protein
MLIFDALVLTAPPAWDDLLTKPMAAWDARLGAGKGSPVTKGEGDFTLRNRRYRNGTIEVTFLGGRAASVEVVLPASPALAWSSAIRAAGLPTQKATAKALGETKTTGVTDQTLISVPSLPKGVQVAFVRRGSGTKATEQVVSVSVPNAVRLAPNPAERKAILDAARAEVFRATKQKVIFRVADLRMGDDWAFLSAEPRTPQDGKADWSRLAPAGFEVGAYDPIALVLLRREGARWKVRALELGPTDVAWAGWSKEFNAPYGLFSDRRL